MHMLPIAMEWNNLFNSSSPLPPAKLWNNDDIFAFNFRYEIHMNCNKCINSRRASDTYLT